MPHFPRVPRFYNCVALITIWQIDQNVPYLSNGGALFQVCNTFPNMAHISKSGKTCASVRHFSYYGALFKVWRIFQSVLHFSICAKNVAHSEICATIQMEKCGRLGKARHSTNGKVQLTWKYAPQYKWKSAAHLELKYRWDPACALIGQKPMFYQSIKHTDDLHLFKTSILIRSC